MIALKLNFSRQMQVLTMTLGMMAIRAIHNIAMLVTHVEGLSGGLVEDCVGLCIHAKFGTLGRNPGAECSGIIQNIRCSRRCICPNCARCNADRAASNTPPQMERVVQHDR